MRANNSDNLSNTQHPNCSIVDPMLLPTNFSIPLLSNEKPELLSYENNNNDPLLVLTGSGYSHSSNHSSSSSSSSERNSIFSEEEDGDWEWCENLSLGIKVGRNGNMVRVSCNTKSYICNFTTRSIDVYKPNKCYFPKEEKCFIRSCYDYIRDFYSAFSKKQIAAVLYAGIYDANYTTDEVGDITNAAFSIQQQVIQSEIVFMKDKQFKHIQQLVYNFARFDSFKVDYDRVLHWLESQLNLRAEKRAFDLVYCAYYTSGYTFGSITDEYDLVNHSIIDEIRSHKREIRSIPSAISVQYGIGILQFNSCFCMFQTNNH